MMAHVAAVAPAQPAAPAAVARPQAASQTQTPVKTGRVATKVLLPLFLVDTTDPDGPSTFFAVRNESNSTVEVKVFYYAAETPYDPVTPGPTLIPPETLTIAAKAIHADNVRTKNLLPESDGFARGYVIFETVGGEGAIQGDYFQINGREDFASGQRLINIDPESSGNELCRRFSMRFIESPLLFDSGTVFTVWLQPALPFGGIAFAYSAFGTAGGASILDLTLPSAKFAFQITAGDLLFGVDEGFGAIEFEFPADSVGHISGIMSAFARLSVGFEATCLDPS